MASADQLLKAIQTIESQLEIVKHELKELGIKEEGIVGTFDGEAMITEDGRRFVIPPNYASKSMLVAGDTLRMTEDQSGGDQHRFKQIAKSERSKATGLLTRKDGKFEVICEEGSFKVLTAAIKHYEGEPGDQVTIQFAKNHTKGAWAAVEKVIKASTSNTLSPVVAQSTGQPAPLATGPAVIAHAPQPVSVTPSVQPEPIAPVVASMPSVVETPPPATASAAAEPTGPARQPSSPSAPLSNNHKSKSSQRSDGKAKSRSKAQSTDSASRYKAKPSDAKRTAAPEVTPRPAAPPIPQPTNLSPSQGEISIPSVMDDDDLT